jgi:hypothetical protein
MQARRKRFQVQTTPGSLPLTLRAQLVCNGPHDTRTSGHPAATDLMTFLSIRVTVELPSELDRDELSHVAPLVGRRQPLVGREERLGKRRVAIDPVDPGALSGCR